MQRLTLPSERAQRLRYIREQFPEAEGPDAVTVGGRAAAEQAMQAIDPAIYGRTRNHVHGKVTRLSMYLRHGCLTLEQVRRYALSVAKPSQAYKLIFELAWRDFWRRLWYQLGESALHHPIESAKVPLGTHGLPQDIQQGQTGLACMDAFVAELKATGYVHNHARMWFAAYCVHTRKVDWHAAADWYWCHLLDGDLASNHLSWQWVASTFSHKAYFFNRENLERYTDGEYCQRCQAVCPFDASYETLAQRWFTP